MPTDTANSLFYSIPAAASTFAAFELTRGEPNMMHRRIWHLLTHCSYCRFLKGENGSIRRFWMTYGSVCAKSSQ